MKKSLITAAVAVAALLSACLLAAHSSAQTPTTWNGGTSTWENAAFWNNGVPNSSSADAFIDGGKTGVNSVVTQQSFETVGRLTLDAGDTLNIGSNFTFQAGSFTGSGSVINNGTINNNANNIFYVGSASLSGTGTLNLLAVGSGFGASLRAANANGDRLTIGAGQTIAGSTNSNNGGSMGGGTSTFTNNGTVNANTSLDSFVIAPGGGNGNDFTNGATGLAEATNGGVLILSGGIFNNGTFQALDGSEVLLSNNLSINNAIFATAGTGFILLNSGQPILTGVTNSGTFNVVATSATIAGGNLTNSGTMTLSGSGTLSYNGNTSFTGTGTINLLAAGTAFGESIRATTSGDRLTIGAGQTIAGSTQSNNGGSLGTGSSTITNNGTINANTSSDSFLIAPGGGNGNDFTNGATGLVEATNGGAMIFQIAGVYTNNGTYAVVSGATGGSSSFTIPTSTLTNFSGTTLTGGTYNVTSSDPANTSTLTFGGGTIATNAANVTLDGVNTVFAEINGLTNNQGSFTIADGRNFTTVGALTNSGTLAATGGSTLSTNGALTQNGTLLIGPEGAVVVNGGDYTQGGGSSLQIQIDADNPAGFQQLTVNGTAHLAGTLQVAFLNGYMPPPNQTFVIVQAAAIDGQFDQVVGATASYTATEVIITPTQTTTGPTLTGAVSRKTHGSAGDFDLPLVLAPAGSGTVEPRAGGPTTLVFTFSEDVVAADGMISSNEFTITNATYSSASISGNTITLNLTGIIDQSVVSIAVNGITNTNGDPLMGDNDVEIRALAGDANQNQTVDKPDLQGIKDHAGQPLEQMSGNYLFDLDLDGVIGKLDGRVVKMNKLHTVP